MVSYRTTPRLARPANRLTDFIRSRRGLVVSGFCVVTTAFVLAGLSMRSSAADENHAGEITASLTAPPEQLGPSGLPLPRFVTIKASKVNVRKGPSSDHDVAWVYQRKGMPVEITLEFENWRKIRDSEGGEGWILQSMLSGKRNALVADWAKHKSVILHDSASERSAAVAKLSVGVISEIKSCNGQWCYVVAADYEGYARQNQLWGVYPDEKLD
jgi:SH3-like domain-containing protein